MQARIVRQLGLTPSEAEVLATLPVSCDQNAVTDAKLISYQNGFQRLAATNQKNYDALIDLQVAVSQAEAAFELYEMYLHGDAVHHITPNKVKAQKYLRLASQQYWLLDNILKQMPVIPAHDKSFTAQQSAVVEIDASVLKLAFVDAGIECEENDNGLHTSLAYKALGWFTSTRLFLARANRVAVETGHSILSTVAKPMGIGGLSYGLELVFDLGVVCKNTFFPSKKERAITPSMTDRFINAMNKDDRLDRMRNAAIWFGINLACFIITGGFSAYVNLAAYAFDVGHEIYKTYREVKKYQKVLDKIETQKQVIEEKINNSIDLDQITSLSKEYQKLERLETAVQNKIEAVQSSQLYAIAVTAAILIGMVLFFFPPTGVPAIVGAAIALGAGSVFGGFGKRIWDGAIKPAAGWLWNKITKPNSDKEIEMTLQPKPTQKLDDGKNNTKHMLSQLKITTTEKVDPKPQSSVKESSVASPSFAPTTPFFKKFAYRAEPTYESQTSLQQRPT